MSSIAFRCISGMFALAIVSGFGLLSFKDHRDKTGAFMLAVTEWLVFRLPTGAIGIFLAGFDFDLFGKAGSDFWFVHARIFLDTWRR